jgi:hypothetical protein
VPRSYSGVESIINPNQFGSDGRAYDYESHVAVVQGASITDASDGRYKAVGTAEDQYDERMQRVEQPGSYRTPLRAKVAAIHAARDATSQLGYSNG